MGIFFSVKSWGELNETADSAGNDGFVSLLAAMGTEAVGWAVKTMAHYKPDLVRQLLATSRINEIHTLADLAISTSSHRKLVDIAGQVTNPTAIAYYERLVAQAEL